MSQGTPKNLKEALMVAICLRPLKDVMDDAPSIIKDFLAQKFGAALLKAENQQEVDAIKELWEQIIKE